MEDKVEEYEESVRLPGEEETGNPVKHEAFNITEEIQTLVTEISVEADKDYKDVSIPQYDQKLMHDGKAQIETDTCEHQKTNFGKTSSLDCSQRSKPKTPARRYSSAESAFQKMSVNEQIQDEQNFSIGIDEDLLGICESATTNSVHPRIEPKLINSEVAANNVTGNILDKDLSSTRQRDSQREQTNTSNSPYKLTVEDKYLNVSNTRRKNSLSPEPLRFRPNIPVSQTIMPNAEILELCRYSRNQRRRFYFPVENSPDQDSPKARLPISRLASNQCKKTEEMFD